MNLIFQNLDPVIFSFSFAGIEFALRWYAISYIAGLLFAWKFMQLLVTKTSLWTDSLPPMNKLNIEDLMTYMILGVVVGGRLGYIIFYTPEYYFQNPIEILMVWKGGMSFHGGFLGVVAGAIIFAIKNKFDLLHVGDLIAVASPPGLFFGRLANFINGELWGKPTLSDWGVVFSSKAAQTCPLDWVGPCTRHPSQFYEAILEGIVLWIIMLFCVFVLKSFTRKGEMINIFLIGYSISRIVVEIFREPDLQFVSSMNPNGYVFFITESFGFSMGQILSIPMFLIGLIFLSYITIKRVRDR